MIKAAIVILLAATYGQHTSGHPALKTVIKDNFRSTEGKSKQGGIISASSGGNVTSVPPTKKPGNKVEPQSSKGQEEEEGDLEAVIRFFASTGGQDNKVRDRKNVSRSKRSGVLSTSSTASNIKGHGDEGGDDLEKIINGIFGHTNVSAGQDQPISEEIRDTTLSDPLIKPDYISQKPSTSAPQVDAGAGKERGDDWESLVNEIFGHTNVSSAGQDQPTSEGIRGTTLSHPLIKPSGNKSTQEPSTIAPQVVVGAGQERGDDWETLLNQVFGPGNVSSAGQDQPISEGIRDTTLSQHEGIKPSGNILTQEPFTIAPQVIVDSELTRCLDDLGDEGACVPLDKCKDDEYGTLDVNGYEDPCSLYLSCCPLDRVITDTIQADA